MVIEMGHMYEFQKKRIEALEKDISELKEQLQSAFRIEEPEIRREISIKEEIIQIIKG